MNPLRLEGHSAASYDSTSQRNGRFVLLPVTDETRGHGTHTIARLWQHLLAELLAATNN